VSEKRELGLGTAAEGLGLSRAGLPATLLDGRGSKGAEAQAGGRWLVDNLAQLYDLN